MTASRVPATTIETTASIYRVLRNLHDIPIYIFAP